MSAALGRVCGTGRMPEGMVFCPFHFPEQPASRAVSGELEEVSQGFQRERRPAWSGYRLAEVFKHRLGYRLRLGLIGSGCPGGGG
ncbi:MAG: hypothetical protein WCD20_00315 [Rhodomicrobium sp.]